MLQMAPLSSFNISVKITEYKRKINSLVEFPKFSASADYRRLSVVKCQNARTLMTLSITAAVYVNVRSDDTISKRCLWLKFYISERQCTDTYSKHCAKLLPRK